MNSIEAFNALMQDEKYLKKLGPRGRKEFYSYRNLLKKGKIKNLDNFLEKHGFVKISEPQWKRKVK